MKETKWEILDKKDAFPEYNDGKLTVSMKTDIWSYICLHSSQFPCEANKIYKFSIDTKQADTDFRIFIQFYGKEEDLPYRHYIKDGEEFCVPEGMDRFDVDIIATAEEDAVIFVGGIDYTYLRDYTPKNVCMCAISDNMLTPEMKTDTHVLVLSYCKLIDEVVAKEHPDVIVLTETYHDRCVPPPALADKFIGYDDESVTLIEEKAAEHGIYINTSYHILENGCRYNRSILFDRKGEIIGEYDKTHLTVMERGWGMKPGNEICVVDTDIGKLGLIVCYDTFFPEFLRMYHLAGCDILLCPTRGNARHQNYAAAFTTSASLVLASDHRWNQIHGIDGEMLDISNMAEGKGYAVATVDINKKYWKGFLSVGEYHGDARDVFMNDRRPEIYMPLTYTEKR